MIDEPKQLKFRSYYIKTKNRKISGKTNKKNLLDHKIYFDDQLDQVFLHSNLLTVCNIWRKLPKKNHYMDEKNK